MERSKGRFDITIFYAGELPYGKADEFAAITDGQANISEVWDIHVVGAEEFLGVLTLPTIFESNEQGKRISQEAVTPYVDKVLRKHQNCFTLYRVIWNVQQLYTAKKTTSLADWKGQKIRAASPTQQQVLADLGVIPVSLNPDEVYMAVQRGTLDGWVTGPAAAAGQASFEIMKWLLVINMTPAADFLVVDVDSFNALPKDLQNLVMETAKEFEESGYAKARAYVEDAYKQARDMNVTITELSASDQQLIKQYGDAVAENFVNKGGPETKELYRLINEAK